MSKKEYTLTGKSTITGTDYHFSRGDIITQAQYDKLSKKHKAVFTEGRKDLSQRKPSQSEIKKQEAFEELEKRVEELEKTVAEITTEPKK